MNKNKNLDTVTFTVTVSKQTLEKLQWLANCQNINATSVLEIAVATEFYIKQNIAKGKRILIQSSDKSIQVIKFN